MGRGRPPNGAEWLTIQLCRAFEAHVLSEPEQAWAAPPLPAAFGSAAELYSCMKALVLDEAFAMVREGLASRKRALTLRMRIDGTLRASERGARLAALSVTAVGASAPDLSSALRSGSVFLLSRGECQLLAVLDGRSQAWARLILTRTRTRTRTRSLTLTLTLSQEGMGKCVLEVSDAALVRLSDPAAALAAGSLWSARCAGDAGEM